MRYLSTRGAAPALEFEDVLLAGLARDGGLYVPEAWPRFTADAIRAMHGLSYADIAIRVMRPYLGAMVPGGAIMPETFAAMVRETYAGFGHPAVAPLRQLDDGLWLMELFHGPTLAFKDYAMQLLGRLFDRVLSHRGNRVTIIGATSGDTGSAAIEACRDRDRIEAFILFPDGRVSPVQRRQMTTVAARNAHAVALDGTFDDCQALVKALFSDSGFRDRHHLSAVNSINWARLMPQIAYYFAAATALGAPDRPVAFSVPTGNFGNVFAAYAAMRMGLPIAHLLVGSNRNDILTRFLASGEMAVRAVEPSLSPSMDIQVSSNFERLLFELHDRDGAGVVAAMQRFRSDGRFTVAPEMLARAGEIFSGHRVDDAATIETMRAVHEQTGETIDPHTAIGVSAARAARCDGRVAPEVPIVALACAHPAKFPDAVERATGRRPPLPPRLADLMQRPEHLSRCANDPGAIRRLIRDRAAAREAAA